ncbi:hypothetical protein OROHE_022539 [Orobanche hederae]
MTLDDFFTLTEVNNGLSALSRVRELVAVMQKEKDCIVKNGTDLTRQRSVVASAIAATENKDCLDLFLQLDGLRIISSWLKDAQKFSSHIADSFLEESITDLLRALEKLHVDYEKLVASEIWTSVENLLVHNSPIVQDRARVLLENWKTKRDIDASVSDVDKTGAFTNDEGMDGTDNRRERESSPKNASISRETSLEDNGPDLTKDDQVLSTSSDAVVHPDQVESAWISNKTLDLPTGDERPPDHDNSDTHSNFHDLKSMMSQDGPFTSISDAVADLKSVTDPRLKEKSNAGNENPCSKVFSSYIDSKTIDCNGKSEGDDDSDANQCGSSNAFIAKEEGGVIDRSVLPKSFSSEKSWGKFLSGIRDDSSGSDLANNYAFGKKQMDRGFGKKSVVEIDYGVVDPLEVAMQVAMEVERENVDYMEQSHSPSEKLLESNTNGKQSEESADSVSGKQSHSSEGPPMKTENNTSSSEDSATTSSENLNTNDMQDDVAASQVTEAAQEEPHTTEKSSCNFFDLNQEFFSEDSSRPENQFSAPVSVVSASRATAAPKLPSAPLHFEGNLGWKGSASTSAFRPASPRRMPENDFSSSSSSKQRQGNCCLDIDLNVSDIVDESSLETNSKRSELLELDLNCASEDGNVIGNIDLNDRPSFLNVPFENNSYIGKASRNFNVLGGISIKSDDSAISIMGTRVEVNRKNGVSQTPELAFDYNLGRTGSFIGIGSAVPYAHSSVYGYSNIVPGPVMPFSSPIYGAGHHSIPYMVDSRGAPVVPQIMGSASAMPTAFSQPPFVININGSTTPSNVIGPSRSGFDLNSGMLVESGSKDTAGLGLFLNSAQVRSVNVPSYQATMSSAVGGKRKEPDNGYSDHYYPLKHYTPPWRQS